MSTARDIFKPRDRKPSIRQRRAVEIYLADNGIKTKGEALRMAGYSEGVAISPPKVFESRAVIKLMEEMGVTDKLGMEILARNAKAKVPVHFTFPPFREPNETKDGEDGNEGDKFGEQMTDAQIREYLEGAGCRVTRIVHGDLARHVYCYTLNNKAQLATADMIFNLTGSYAPKKVEGKHDHRVGIFSMKDLRQKMKEKGIKITDPIESFIQDNNNQDEK